MAYTETRQHKRALAQSSAQITTPLISGFSVVGLVEEISAGGCRLKSHRGFEEGHELNITVNLAGIEINAGAKVVRRTKEGVDSFSFGLAFTRIEPMDLKCIESYVSNRGSAAA